MLQFTLYPLVVALANDRIESERRVSLAACLLMSFGIGASIGPLVVGALMEPLGGRILYAFFILCGLAIMLLNRSAKKEEEQLVEDAPLPHIAMPDSLISSPLSPALNPSFDEQMIQENMPAPEPSEEESNEEPVEEEQEERKEQETNEQEKGLEKAYTIVS